MQKRSEKSAIQKFGAALLASGPVLLIAASAASTSAIGSTQAEACAKAKSSAISIYGRSKIKGFGHCNCTRQGSPQSTWYDCKIAVALTD